MEDDMENDLIRFPNRLSSISEIVAHNTSVVCRLRNQTPQSLAELARMPMQDVLDVLENGQRSYVLFSALRGRLECRLKPSSASTILKSSADEIEAIIVRPFAYILWYFHCRNVLFCLPRSS
jgi:hypothetical protein